MATDAHARADAVPPAGQGSSAPKPEDLRYLSYEGSKVPTFLTILWVVFLVFSVVYLALFVPESMSEWFRE